MPIAYILALLGTGIGVGFASGLLGSWWLFHHDSNSVLGLHSHGRLHRMN